jgi:MOSC domain-containing protein YiiM
MQATVKSVSASTAHQFSKRIQSQIVLLVGQGIEGDAHCGVTVKHRSRVAKDPSQPNLRQVHLIHAELLDELALQGFCVSPGRLGENVTTTGIDLLSLPRDTELALGETALVKLTGLRNPCAQIDTFQTGLMSAVLGRTADGELVRKAGVMGVVLHGGVVRAGDSISVNLPARPYQRLERV